MKPAFKKNDTICALATPSAIGALAITRVSGPKAMEFVNKIFQPTNKKHSLLKAQTHTILYGQIINNKTKEIIDDVLVSKFVSPHSYTGEDSIEISCHGSPYIQKCILELLVLNGARIANPGEFTLRAFLNGKLDLSQAEAVADLISSQSKATHEIAMKQMRGGFSSNIKQLRDQLVKLASLIELELDFSEEDVEFANRKTLNKLLKKLQEEISPMIDSFSMGNVLKTGIPIAIIGKPNVGKSTLLNALLNEEKAIVSEIPGTTRDAIEDVITMGGIPFRFIDTAGLRKSDDTIESIGIKKTKEKIKQATIILYVFDVNEMTVKNIIKDIQSLGLDLKSASKKIILIGNKIDKSPTKIKSNLKKLYPAKTLYISAKRKQNISKIEEALLNSLPIQNYHEQTIITNNRHYEALHKTSEALKAIREGIRNHTPTDLIAVDIRKALHHLGSITGEVTSNEILHSIFSKFCIGK